MKRILIFYLYRTVNNENDAKYYIYFYYVMFYENLKQKRMHLSDL